MDKYLEILKQYWGYDDFRPLQGDIIQSVASGKDTLGLMPTGGGKSLTFQVPAMAMEGVCLVVTPLIALMKDQVENLSAKGISAAAIYTGMSKDDVLKTLDNCIFDAYKFLYISPERLATKLFLEKISKINVCLMAIDESHCISQWGYDFRPSYLKIAEVRQFFTDVPVLALTATATPEVVIDIQEKLGFKERNVFKKSFRRSNLCYVVRKTETKEEQLLQILNKVSGSSVVYVRNRKRTAEVAELLTKNGISAEFYHAGLKNETKDARQLRWKKDETRVIVSTNAFGMGIDKPEVRTVVHMDVPDSMEAYYQEAGRAGRDEKKAYGVLLFNNSDVTKLKKRVADQFPAKDFVLKVYEFLGSYYQLAVGSAMGLSLAFDLIDFCAKFKLPMLMTHNAIHILQYAGYLELSEDEDRTSRVLILVGKEDLYKVKYTELQEKLMYVLLRSYTGLFTEPAYIREELLASRINSTPELVYKSLVALSKERIIQYIPRKQTPFLTFVQDREETSRVVISKDAYDLRKKRYVDKIQSMINYVQDGNHCRSQLLLSYFGEKDSLPCGQCDICLSRKEGVLTEVVYKKYAAKILEILQKTDLSPSQLSVELKINKNIFADLLRYMMDQGQLSLDESGKLKYQGT